MFRKGLHCTLKPKEREDGAPEGVKYFRMS